MAADHETETETVTVEVPAAYTEVPIYPNTGQGRPPDYDVPTLTYASRGEGHGENLYFNIHARALYGDADGVRCFTHDMQVAPVPSHPDHPNAYRVNWRDTGGGQFAAGWLKQELPDEPAYGVYELEWDGELWVVDFSDPLEVR